MSDYSRGCSILLSGVHLNDLCQGGFGRSLPVEVLCDVIKEFDLQFDLEDYHRFLETLKKVHQLKYI